MSKHVEAVWCYPDGRVEMRGTMPGLFAGAAALLGREARGTLTPPPAGAAYAPVVPCRRADLCRAVAGELTAAPAAPSNLPRQGDLERKAHPAETFLDADSRQHEAIAAAVRGANLVLDGPPGTGKSQTIANIIAEFLAVGKTVLFVSEKAAALEVVQRRLAERGLGDFLLACHSHKANKRDIVAELGRCLEFRPEQYPDSKDDPQRLCEVRQQLNAYVQELHQSRDPLGRTVYQVHGELAWSARQSRASHCPVPQVLERDAAYLRRVEGLLARLPDCRSVVTDRDLHQWRDCRAAVFSESFREEVRYHFGRLAAALDRLSEAKALLHGTGIGWSDPTWEQWRWSLAAARSVLACPVVPAAWFESDARAAAEAVVQADDLTRAYRDGLAAAPEFVPDAVLRADPAAM